MELDTDDSAPSEARKRGSGGGSPRKYDDLLTGSFGPGRSVKVVMEPGQVAPLEPSLVPKVGF
jgi:hypothetical protein